MGARRLFTMERQLGELVLADGVDARAAFQLLRRFEAHFAAREPPAAGYRLHAGGKELADVRLAPGVDVRQLVSAQRRHELCMAEPDEPNAEAAAAPVPRAAAVRRRGGG